ncbi:MAG TPA: hypothetical protein VF525_15980 [Pyrinomonadaceae bacterium]|jgi:hypothetical protein
MPRLEDIVDTEQLQRAADGEAAFEVNPFMERLIQMRRERSKSLAVLSPAVISSLVWYEAGKRRAQILNRPADKA